MARSCAARAGHGHRCECILPARALIAASAGGALRIRRKARMTCRNAGNALLLGISRGNADVCLSSILPVLRLSFQPPRPYYFVVRRHYLGLLGDVDPLLDEPRL